MNGLFGRRVIYATFDDIDESNIIVELNKALAVHVQNLLEEEALYWYRRGATPVLDRTKEVRPEICNKVNESASIANEIVDFKNGFFLTQPAFYISRNEESQEKVDLLNEYLYRSGKQLVDNEVADWFHTVGKAAIFVKPTDDVDVPVKCYCLDPRSAFVVYSLTPGNKPIMGVNMVVSDDKLKFDVYTKDYVFRCSGTSTGRLVSPIPTFVATAYSVDSVERNILGAIPIIEYSYNSINTGSFENVISMLDALAEAQSDRVDGLSQQIQNLLVLYNCQLDDDTTANSIRQAGMIQLKSVGENKADVKDITTVIDQAQTQVLIDDLYERILSACSMPTTTKGGTSTSDTGAAVLLRDGWSQASSAAMNTEDLFKKSNRRFDKIFTDILRRAGLLDIKMTDFELHFNRNDISNAFTKAQTLQILLASGVHPEIAFARSGISSDPVSDVLMSEKYLKLHWGDVNAPQEQPDKVEKIDETVIK